MKNKKLLNILLCSVIFSVILVVDLITKEFIIKNNVPNVGDEANFIPGFMNFIYVQNKGGAWGIFSNSTIFLSIISLLILIAFTIFYIFRVKKCKNHTSIWLSVAFGLVAGGSVGNLVDRFAFGYVRDFLNFQFIDFPVFNVADIAVTVGMIAMFVYFVFFYSKEEKNDQKSTQTGENNGEK